MLHVERMKEKFEDVGVRDRRWFAAEEAVATLRSGHRLHQVAYFEKLIGDKVL